MQQFLAYWIGVFVRALYAFPTFIGNNWIGVLLSAVFLIYKSRHQFTLYFRISPATHGWFQHATKLLGMAYKTNWRIAAAILSLFFLVDVLTVALTDQQSLTANYGRLKADIRRAKITCDDRVRQTTSVLNGIINDLRQTNSGQTSTIDTLEKQTRSQQDTINGFGTQIIKATVTSLKTVPIGFDLDTSNPARKTSRWIVLTNKPIASMIVQVRCTKPFEITAITVLGGENLIGGSPEPLSPNLWDIPLPSPWTPTTPLLVGMAHGSASSITCFFIPK